MYSTEEIRVEVEKLYHDIFLNGVEFEKLLEQKIYKFFSCHYHSMENSRNTRKMEIFHLESEQKVIVQFFGISEHYDAFAFFSLQCIL